MKEFIGILLSILSPLFLFVGSFIVSKFRNTKKIFPFSIALCIIFIILIDVNYIFTGAIDLLNNKFITSQSYAFVFLMSIVGYIIMKLLDYRISNNKVKNSNMKLVCLLGFILFLYFIICGINIYDASLISIKKGLYSFINYSLINTTFGICLDGIMKSEKDYKQKRNKVFFYLSLGYIIGALLAFIFNIKIIKNFTLGIFLSLIFGMLIYIIIFELWPRYKESNERFIKALGLIVGGIIILIGALI